MNDLREVDLERGMPRAEQAIRQMLFELRRSPGLGCSGVKLIHGYGSSGAGGRIRVEARRRLDRMKAGGEIWGYIPGESQQRRDLRPAVRERQSSALDRKNEG